ncbi:unnamed protein product [Scytosiphon promiscuus]
MWRCCDRLFHGYSCRDDEISTGETGDALLHMFPLPDTNFERIGVSSASKNARSLTAKLLPHEEERAHAALVGTALANKELADKAGSSSLGVAFEEVTHRTIRSTENGGGSDGRTFDMEIRQDSCSGDCKV